MRQKRIPGHALVGAALLLGLFKPAPAPDPARPAPARAADSDLPVERGRDPLGIVRTTIRPRVWILLDTSESMNRPFGDSTRFRTALEAIRRLVDGFVSPTGEPVAHWRLATFRRLEAIPDPGAWKRRTCSDRTSGAGLPIGSPPGPPVAPALECGGLRVVTATAPDACDARQARDALLARLPRATNSAHTPNGIALYQLAARIRHTTPPDRAGRDVILLVTDGLDSCECRLHPWLDFNEGRRGRRAHQDLPLRPGGVTPMIVPVARPDTTDVLTYNSGLKAKAAFLTLNGGDPEGGLNDIRVVGVDMVNPRLRAATHHLAWTASNLRHPAIHAARPEDLLEALDQVMNTVTLPPEEVRLTEPRFASVKELAAAWPAPGAPEADRPDRAAALVVPPGASAAELAAILALRARHADNLLIASGADLDDLVGHLRAFPTPASGAVERPDSPIWDGGALLARRAPGDRAIFYNRPGETRLRAFAVGSVTAADLGVGPGYLAELDGVGARTGADAAEIVVRMVRGETLSLAGGTGTIYRADGALNFSGGVGTWKLREGLGAPVVVTNPRRRPEHVPRNREAYETFFGEHLNRRTMVYLPTSGGLLHAFAGDTGEELFAYIPDDVLGPPPGAGAAPGRLHLRDLATAGIVDAPGFRDRLAGRFTLAGSPVIRDVYDPVGGVWRSVLAFGRSVGGRFVTALDVSGVGDGWDGSSRTPRVGLADRGAPRLLFNHGPGGSDPLLAGLGETPEPLLVEIPGEGHGAWVTVLPAGAGARDTSVGEWLYVLGAMDGRVRRRLALPAGDDPVIGKNGVVVPAAPWQPDWATVGARDLVTRIYLGDLHGQIHRLDVSTPSAWDFEVVHRLGGDHPIVTPLVVFPFPDRAEPHLLVVTGGDGRAPGGASHIALLRDTGGRLEEVWRRALDPGETPQGKPVVRLEQGSVNVVLATRTAATETVTCDAVERVGGVSRLRAFNGLTGAEAFGVIDPGAAILEFGTGRVRGVSLSATGNMAVSVTSDPGDVIDAVIGDFKFKVRDSALEEIMLFVEGFRRSPF